MERRPLRLFSFLPIFLLLLLLHGCPHRVLGLECVCGSLTLNPHRADLGEVNPVCETPQVIKNKTFPFDGGNTNLGLCSTSDDGKCFQNVYRREVNVVVIYYGCVAPGLLHPPKKPFFCHSSHKNNVSQVGCCGQADLCNFKMSVPIPKGSGKPSSRYGNSLRSKPVNPLTSGIGNNSSYIIYKRSAGLFVKMSLAKVTV